MREAKRHIAGFLVLAWLLSCLAAYLVYERVSAVEAQLGDRVDVLVAAESIPAQVPLEERHLKTVSLPSAFLQPGMVTDPAEVVGKVSLVELPPGALILSHAVKDRVVIPADKRLIRLYRSQVVQFDFDLMVGDEVDVIVTVPGDQAERYRTELLLSGLPVVDVAADRSWVGVEVPAEDAPRLVGMQVQAVLLQLLRVTPQREEEAS